MTSTFNPPRRWGFEITAVRQSDGQGTGSFDIGGSTLMQIVNGARVHATRQYVQHTSAGTFANTSGPVDWTFKWKAPTTNVGRISFFAAGNAANNSGSSSGDHIYTTSALLDPNPLLDVTPTPEPNVLEAAPNPTHGRMFVRYSLARRGAVDLAVFDPQGRRVRGLMAGERPAGTASVTWDGTRDDGAAAGPGVYFVRLVLPGSGQRFARRVTLVR
jgi:hypothetical protein